MSVLSPHGVRHLQTPTVRTLNANDPGPAWATYSTVHAPTRVVINSFPLSAHFGQNTVAITEALVGAVDVPATAAGGNHCTGVSGYARTVSSGQGAVGVFGAGFGAADSVSAFGANFLASNAAAGQSTPGYNANVYGIEVDVNIYAQNNGSSPTGAVRGVYVSGGSTKDTSGFAHAVDVEHLGTGIPWDSAYFTNDAAATIGIDLGTTGTGNTVGSQSINLRSRDAGGNDTSSSLSNDADGNVTLNMGGGVFVLQDSGTTQFRVVSKVIENCDPLVALGGGVAPTLGTIGGSGPATAAQNSWMRMRDSGGNFYWVPIWK